MKLIKAGEENTGRKLLQSVIDTSAHTNTLVTILRVLSKKKKGTNFEPPDEGFLYV